MREARHLDKSAALVTPDRALARGDGGIDPLNLDSTIRRRRTAGHFGGYLCRSLPKPQPRGEPPALVGVAEHPLFRLGVRMARSSGH